MRVVLASLLTVLFLAATAAAQKSPEGVWRLTEVTATGADGGTRQATQPSLYLFTKKHYSITYVAGDKARTVADASTLSADELRSTFVDSFIANAGSYEYKGGKLTIHPIVAKSPGYMKDGTWTTYLVKMDGGTMTITSESTNSGPSANPTTFKLIRVE